METPEIQEFFAGGWHFLSRSGRMMPSTTLDQLSAELKFNHIPEVTFATNLMQITHNKKGLVYYMSTIDALKYTNYEYLTKHYEGFTEKTETNNNRAVNYIPEKLVVKASEIW